MNLSPGGSTSVPMHDTTWNGKPQKMNEVDPSNPNKMRNKGLKQILNERKLWPKEGLSRDAAREKLSQCDDFNNERSHGLCFLRRIDRTHAKLYMRKNSLQWLKLISLETEIFVGLFQNFMLN